ncbi:hypothetical protein [Okeania sp. KiyG1]|uniref:hypothetical protein n=1 Tax=Okeania sp. KiyG1 TaxID=2720165 RepID=UPI001922EB77|nr:hypothetical protein [Okeania sp. KiyG1]GGA39230.1 hypothetical protein CYANOKiyG1_57410 [Okeania sp. KiyG1]
MVDSDIDILKRMIQPEATVALESEYQKNIVKLTEDCDNYTVTIYGMPDDDEVIVIKVDTFSAPKEIFQANRGECKRADFAIIADIIEKGKFIVFIEMKGGKKTSKEKEIIQQLKGAQCFVEYCQAIGKSFWEKQDFLDDYKYRFVSIKNIKIPKSKTRYESKANIHDTPENMLKISSPNHIQFNHLIGHKK